MATRAPSSPSPATGLWLDGAQRDLGRGLRLGPLSLHLTEARIGVIGGNGAGKSSLLRLIAGLTAPEAGQVRVEGIDPSGDRRGLIAALGILFQNPERQILFPNVTEELAFGLRQMGQSAAAAEKAVAQRLTELGRADWLGRPVEALSQGQKHYLCLQALLLMAPENILLDEPFAGLDLPSALWLKAALAALPQRLLHVSHDLALLSGYDRILWLEGGQIVADGPPRAVLPAYRRAMEARAKAAARGGDV